jgi:hypothetical protein
MNASRTTIDSDREISESDSTSTDATTFEIDRQSGANISNVGGDQTIYYGDRGRGTRASRVLAAVGLLLSLAGCALLVLLGAMTAHSLLHDAHSGGVQGPYTHYVPSYWPAAAGLLLGGFIFRRFVRIMVGR